MILLDWLADMFVNHPLLSAVVIWLVVFGAVWRGNGNQPRRIGR
jgi:hypothetical protein